MRLNYQPPVIERCRSGIHQQRVLLAHITNAAQRGRRLTMKKSIRLTNDTVRTEGYSISIRDARFSDDSYTTSNPGVELEIDGKSWARLDVTYAEDRAEAKRIASALRKAAKEIEAAMKRQGKKKPTLLPDLK